MGPTWRRIHLSGTNWPVLLSLLHFFLDSLVAIHRVLAQVLHIHAQRLVLTDFQPALGPAARINQQVLDFLIINLDHGELHLVGLGLIGLYADALKDLWAGNGNNTDIRTVADLEKDTEEEN